MSHICFTFYLVLSYLSKTGIIGNDVSPCNEAIKRLKKIVHKGDLAEGYYQLFLTYQEMERSENSQEKFDKSSQIFRKIEANLQVEKVQRVWEKSFELGASSKAMATAIRPPKALMGNGKYWAIAVISAAADTTSRYDRRV